MLETVDCPRDDKTETTRAFGFMLRQAKTFFNSLKGKSPRELMKTKNFYALVLFLLATLTTLWILVDPSPNLHTIVSETHKQISNIHIPTNIRHHTKSELLAVDNKYLDVLGFPVPTRKPTVATHVNTKAVSKTIVRKNVSNAEVLRSEPVIVVPVLPGRYERAVVFLNSVKKFLPGKLVVFYDLGISTKENTLLKKACNGTVYHCEVQMFPYVKYPSHIHSHSLGAYVPICIQESLNKYNAIIWSSPREYFLTKDIGDVIAQAQQSGIVAWPIPDTTSSITYFKMFSYFEVKPEQYYFHRAVKTSHLVVYNTDKVNSQIMLPWIKCALVEECISPTGSQNSGGYCSEKRPRYLYSGCHHYEQSALNLILGKVFDFIESPYTTETMVFGEEIGNKSVTSAVISNDDDYS